jgi:uncharacterized protein
MPVHSSMTSSMVVLKEAKLKQPIVFMSFLDNSAIGVMTLKYVIENLKMSQFAHISSPYIPPVTVFVAGKLRHPFRLYSDLEGKYCIVISDIPVYPEGYYEISNVISDWLKQINPRIVVNIDGFPVDSIVDGQRIFGVGDKNAISMLQQNKIPLAQSALITGMGGAILNESILRKLPLMSLLAVTVEGIPDPAAVEAMNSLFEMKIETGPLKETTSKYHEEMKRIMDDYAKMQSGEKKPDTMYA